MQKIQDAFSQKIVVCGPSKQWEMEEEEALSNARSSDFFRFRSIKTH